MGKLYDRLSSIILLFTVYELFSSKYQGITNYYYQCEMVNLEYDPTTMVKKMIQSKNFVNLGLL